MKVQPLHRRIWLPHCAMINGLCWRTQKSAARLTPPDSPLSLTHSHKTQSFTKTLIQPHAFFILVFFSAYIQSIFKKTFFFFFWYFSVF